MADINLRHQVLDLIKDCTTFPEIVGRLQEHHVLFRPNPLDSLFGGGVSTAIAELLVCREGVELFLRDVHGQTCTLVLRRPGDGMYLQGEFSLVKPGAEEA